MRTDGEADMAAPISETVSENNAATRDIDEVLDPELRRLAISCAEAAGAAALAKAQAAVEHGGERSAGTDIYLHMIRPAQEEMESAYGAVIIATSKALKTNTDEAWEACIRAGFAHDLAAAKVRGIETNNAEARHALLGDERGLGKIGKLGRRGRPRAFDDTLLIRRGRGLVPVNVTPRTRQNLWLQTRAVGAIGIREDGRDPQQQAFAEFYLGRKGDKRGFKAGALVEIGRIADEFGETAARDAATTIYEKYRKSNSRPRTRDIEAELRTWRLATNGHKRPDGEEGLYRKIARVIEGHRKLYPELETDRVREVLYRVLNDLPDQQS